MYRVWVEEVLGLKVRGNSLLLDPVIPGWWNGFHVQYRRGKALYAIQVDNPDGYERGVSWVEMDGRRLEDCTIPLAADPVTHDIRVRMGARSDNKVPAPAGAAAISNEHTREDLAE